MREVRSKKPLGDKGLRPVVDRIAVSEFGQTPFIFKIWEFTFSIWTNIHNRVHKKTFFERKDHCQTSLHWNFGDCQHLHLQNEHILPNNDKKSSAINTPTLISVFLIHLHIFRCSTCEFRTNLTFVSFQQNAAKLSIFNVKVGKFWV